MILLHHVGLLKETGWKRWDEDGKVKTCRRKDSLLSQTSIEFCTPKHVSQMLQIISHHSTNGDVHGKNWVHDSQVGRWSFQLLTGLMTAYSCRGIQDSARLQKICPDIRMSFHGSSYCTWMDSRWYFVSLYSTGAWMRYIFQWWSTAWTLLDTKPCLRQVSHSGRSQHRSSMLWLPAGQGGRLKSTCWVGQVSGICVDLSPRHERAFVSPNPWKQWKHIET